MAIDTDIYFLYNAQDMKKPTISPTSLTTILQSAGLTEKEALLYETLITVGTQSASKLASLAHLKRGITYAALDKLVELGVVMMSKRAGVAVYTPTHPSAIAQLLAKRRSELGSFEHLLTQRMGELAKKFKLAVGRPTVRYFEGEEGIREVFEDIYAPKDDPVYGCVDLEQADKAFPEHIVKNLIPKRIRNGVRAVTILTDSPSARAIAKQDTRQLRVSHLVDQKEYPLPAEIDIYEDKVAMMTFQKKDFVAIIIENANIAQSLRSIFRLAHGERKRVK